MRTRTGRSVRGCRATGRGHLAHKGRTDAPHVCSGWRRILATRWTLIIRAAKKVNIHKRFWLPTLVFFRLAGRTNILKRHRDAACAPTRLFI
jgi:hypothetical protein